MSSLVVVDNDEHLKSQPGLTNQNGLALGLLIENLKMLAVNLTQAVETLEEAQRLSLSAGVRLYDEVQRFEKSLIEGALKLTGGHQTQAAQLLGVNLTTLNSKIKRYHISAKPFALSVAPTLHLEESDAHNQRCTCSDTSLRESDAAH